MYKVIVQGLIMKLFKIALLCGGMLLFSGEGCPAVRAAVAAGEKVKTEVPAEYVQWLDELKQEMVKKGISQKTVDEVFADNYYQAAPEVVDIDRKQIEFILTSTDYLNRTVNKTKVENGQREYKALYPLFRDMERKYGVPFEYIVAFWGMESNYGKQFGKFQVIAALTMLSYDKRRSSFFRKELFEALKIVDKWDVDYKKMEGSWAGAMGHFQFMPSTFNAYAVDYNGDGKIDIWHSFEDAAASAANYLSKIGWKKDVPWGMEVSLPWNFDYAQTGRQYVKTVREWQKLGVKTRDNKKIRLNPELKGAVIVPEGKKGRAYLVLDNFFKIMIWNRSENYSLGVGLLADYVKSGQKWQKLKQRPGLRLKTDDVLKIQSFINRQGWFKLDEDGKLGSKTREAIKGVQRKAKLPQDGYPDYQLLQKINKYNPEIGFAIPVPVRKSEKSVLKNEKQTLRTEKKQIH